MHENCKLLCNELAETSYFLSLANLGVCNLSARAQVHVLCCGLMHSFCACQAWKLFRETYKLIEWEHEEPYTVTPDIPQFKYAFPTWGTLLWHLISMHCKYRDYFPWNVRNLNHNYKLNVTFTISIAISNLPFWHPYRSHVGKTCADTCETPMDTTTWMGQLQDVEQGLVFQEKVEACFKTFICV